MQKLFSMDSKFMRIMGRVGDLILLNFIFLITCVPIITIGAATTALYTVCFRFGTDREEGTVKSYFIAFKENFKQATVLWLILLLVLGTAVINFLVFFVMPAPLHYTCIFFGMVFILAFFVVSYIFPLLSQFESKSMMLFKNALIMSLGYLPRSLVIAALNILPFVLLLTAIYTFLQFSFIWFMLYFSTVAYLNCKLLHKVFAPYTTELEPDQQEDNI